MALDFPSAPTVGQVYNGYVWDGEKWQVQGAAASGAVRYDIAQGLTAAQQSQARANIDVTRKNYIVNGAMMVSQENGTTASALSGYHPVDQFIMFGTSTVTISVAQVTVDTPSGSPNRLRATSGGAATPASGTYIVLRHTIEGLRVADLLFGSANAKTFTLRLGVKAPAGTYGVTFYNSATDRININNFTIAAGEANTDVVKTITLQADTTGTWSKNNAAGLTFDIVLTSAGTIQGTPAGWQAFSGGGFYTTGQFNFFGAAGTFELFDVSLTEGTVAPPFVVPDYASELALCRRYFWRRNFPVGSVHLGTLQAYTPTLAGGHLFTLSPEMRVAPTVTISSVAAFIAYTSGGNPLGTVAANFLTLPDQVYLNTSTFASGLVAGNAVNFLVNSPGAWMQMNARL